MAVAFALFLLLRRIRLSFLLGKPDLKLNLNEIAFLLDFFVQAHKELARFLQVHLSKCHVMAPFKLLRLHSGHLL